MKMKFNRFAEVNWQGNVMQGNGSVTTEGGALNSTPLSFKTRFEGEAGTNPEELLGAAHAGCFTMQLSFLIGEAGFNPTNLDTKATVYFVDGAIPKITLELTAEIPDITDSAFQELAAQAKEICPVSKLMNAEIELKTRLVETV